MFYVHCDTEGGEVEVLGDFGSRIPLLVVRQIVNLNRVTH